MNDVTMVGSSRIMETVRAQLRHLAPLPVKVLLEGESGTGKGVAARLLHVWSGRDPDRWVKLSMGALVASLAHAQLVGHTRGAFTDAKSDVPGALERAHGGTLFLDEMGLAGPEVQGKLLELLEDGMVQRLGEQRPRRVDVRFVFATNADLEDLVRRRMFRPDLLARMGQIGVRMPPLREHKQDIPEIAERALAVSVKACRSPARALAPEDFERMFAYDWPGNVRELVSAMEHYAVFGYLPPKVLRSARDHRWRDNLYETLRRTGGNRSEAARRLGVARQTVQEELRRRRARA